MRQLLFPLITLFILAASVYAQSNGQDTLDIRYEIIGQNFHTDETVKKIQLPPYLSTPEVMEQIKLSVQWPGDPPPEKKTVIYVFKETDKIGAESKTGAIYVPGKGYKWFLNDWTPIEISLIEPTVMEKLIYNTLLDSMFARGMTIHNEEIKDKIAKQFDLTVSKLDSIYLKVKYWKLYWECSAFMIRRFFP